MVRLVCKQNLTVKVLELAMRNCDIHTLQGEYP
jgi:hypothetical protein